MISQDSDLFLMLLHRLSEEFTVRSGLLDPLLQMGPRHRSWVERIEGPAPADRGGMRIDLRRLQSLYALSLSRMSALSTNDLMAAPERNSHCNSFVSV